MNAFEVIRNNGQQAHFVNIKGVRDDFPPWRPGQVVRLPKGVNFIPIKAGLTADDWLAFEQALVGAVL